MNSDNFDQAYMTGKVDEIQRGFEDQIIPALHNSPDCRFRRLLIAF
jgi:hypothetical protein